jgi:CRP-like cAMP-binding protein
MRPAILWGNPFRKVPPDILSEISFLASVPIFDTLSQRQLLKIHKLIHIRHFEEGEIVFRQNDPGVGMYVIRDGLVDVYNEFDDLTRKHILSMKPGDFFGEIALLNDSTRSATVVSAKKSILFGLFRPDLMSVLDSDPKLGNKIIYRIAQIVAERLRLTSLESDS